MRRHLLSLIVSVTLLTNACAPSLRPDPGTPSASPEECESIDSSQQSWGTATAIVLLIGAIGFTTSLVAKPDSSLEKAALGVGAAGAYGGFATYGFQQKNAKEYRDKKCANHRTKKKEDD